MVSNVAGMSKQELMQCISDRKDEIYEKVKKGETEGSFAIGGSSFTAREWDKLLGKVDENIEAVKKEQEERKQEQLESIYEKSVKKCHYFMDKMNGTYKPGVPYEYLAQDGVIEYKGTVFVCDPQRNAICLGDMSDPANVLTIKLSDGGYLRVNRDNFGDLANAISMFSAEDINLIMRAIADDKKAQETLQTIDEETNSIGKDAEEHILSEEQIEKLIH